VCVHERHRRPLGAEARRRFLAAMRGTVVCDPKDPTRGAVWLDAHDLLDKTINGSNGRLGFAPAKQLRAMDVPRSQVRERARPEALVFHAHGTPGTWRQCGMLASARLKTRLLVGRHHEFVSPQRGPVPLDVLVQIEPRAVSPSENRPGWIITFAKLRLRVYRATCLQSA